MEQNYWIFLFIHPLGFEMPGHRETFESFWAVTISVSAQHRLPHTTSNDCSVTLFFESQHTKRNPYTHLHLSPFPHPFDSLKVASTPTILLSCWDDQGSSPHGGGDPWPQTPSPAGLTSWTHRNLYLCLPHLSIFHSFSPSLCLMHFHHWQP